MKWICSRCNTENANTYICKKCGVDESKNFIRYATIAVLQENDKDSFKKAVANKNKASMIYLHDINWKCSNCQTENSSTYICKNCGFDESRDYVRYGSIALLQEKDKVCFRKMIFTGNNVLKACIDLKLVFGRKMSRSEIKSIQIFDTLAGADQSAWDVSEHQDGSVMAWIKTDEDGLKHLYLAANGNIIANKNCSDLFACYTELESIRGIEHLNTENVTDMSGMFEACGILQRLELNSFNTKNVTNMSRMFCGCMNLEKLDLNNFNTENVTDMSWMFKYCERLQKLDLSSFDTRRVKNMGWMFSNCSNLQALYYNFDMENAFGTDTMFNGCSLNIIEQNEKDIKLFQEKDVLENIAKDWGEINYTQSNLKKNVLMACPDAELVFGKRIERNTIRSIEILNKRCLMLSAWDVSANKDGSVMAWIITDKDGWGHLKLAAEGDIIANKNCSHLFEGYSEVKYIRGIEYLNTKNVTDMSFLFNGCMEIRELNVGRFDTSNVTNMRSMFSDCRKIQELNVSGFDTSNVTTMRGMFCNCESVSALDVRGFNTSKVTDMSLMFYGCTNIRKLNVGEFDTGNVVTMRGMFCNCESALILDVRGFNTKNVTDMSLMFYNCAKIQELDVSGFDTGNVITMRGMFSGCVNVQELDIRGFDTSNVTNMNQMFYNCSLLKNINLDSLNTCNVKYMQDMFEGCSKLSKIKIAKFKLRSQMRK